MKCMRNLPPKNIRNRQTNNFKDEYNKANNAIQKQTKSTNVGTWLANAAAQPAIIKYV